MRVVFDTLMLTLFFKLSEAPKAIPRRPTPNRALNRNPLVGTVEDHHSNASFG